MDEDVWMRYRRNRDKAVLGGRKSFVRLHPLRHARLR
jgi:hypothetical protein